MQARWSILNPRALTLVTLPEAIVLGVAAAASFAASLILLPDSRGATGAGLALLMIAIAAVDARRFIIPDELTAAALALGAVNAVLQSSDAIATALFYAVLRGAILALAFWSLRELYRRMRGREGIGLGDVKLAAVAGVWLDLLTIPIAIEIAAAAGLSVCAVKYFRDGRSIRATTKLPFGLFLAPAIWLAWLLGATLLAAPASTSFQ